MAWRYLAKDEYLLVVRPGVFVSLLVWNNLVEYTCGSWDTETGRFDEGYMRSRGVLSYWIFFGRSWFWIRFKAADGLHWSGITLIESKEMEKRINKKKLTTDGEFQFKSKYKGHMSMPMISTTRRADITELRKDTEYSGWYDDCSTKSYLMDGLFADVLHHSVTPEVDLHPQCPNHPLPPVDLWTPRVHRPSWRKPKSGKAWVSKCASLNHLSPPYLLAR